MPATKKPRRDRIRPAPSVAEVSELITQLARHGAQLENDYKAAYADAYAQSGGGSETKTEIWESDPTGNVMSTKAKMGLRSDLANVVERLKDARGMAAAAGDMLDRAVERAHGQFTYTEAVRMSRGESNGSFPRTVTRDQIAEAEAAKARRESRGE